MALLQKNLREGLTFDDVLMVPFTDALFEDTFVVHPNRDQFEKFEELSGRI